MDLISMRLAGIIVMSFVCLTAGVQPTDVRKCHLGDEACVVPAAQYVVDQFAKIGLRELNLVPFDPLHIKLMKLERNPNSPVNVELAFKDVDLIGLKNLKFLKISGFNAAAEGNIEIEATVPKLKLAGPYSVDGSVLILPIVGVGDAEFVLKNSHISAKIKVHPVEKSGQIYLGIENMKMILNPQHAVFRLEGLFNGNKALSDHMNVFINDNWRDIFDELQPAISHALSQIFKQILSNIFSKRPYRELFPESGF